MNAIEQLDRETYTSIEQFRVDCADPRYSRDAIWRGAIERKLSRSMPLLRPSQTATGQKIQAFALATMRDGQPMTASVEYAGDQSPHGVPSIVIRDTSKDTIETIPGGVVRLTKGY